MTERERLVELLNKYFEVGDSDFYVCNRVKEAFFVGTMSLDDFSEIDEENTADIADHLLANGVVVPPYKIGDKLWGFDVEGFVTEYEIQRVDVQLVMETTYYMFYGVDENDELVAFNHDDIGKTVFLTKEEAEQALEGNENVTSN